MAPRTPRPCPFFSVTQGRSKSDLKGVGLGPAEAYTGSRNGARGVCVRGQGSPRIGGERRKRGGRSVGNPSSLVTTGD